MNSKDKRKIIYYSDELKNDFAGTNIKTCTVDGSFKYVHNNIFWRALSFFLYYFVAFPLVFIYEKLILRVRFVNRVALRKYRKKGSFIYGNHTGFYDAFTPNLISFPHRNMIIVGPDTVSIKGIKNLVQMLGAIPIASDIRGIRNFMAAIKHHIKKGRNITVYPEAHIWHYFTGVRSFPDTSFEYPVKHSAPTFAFFTAYTKPKGFLSFLRKANMTVYVSDPIFADEGLSEREQRKNIRDKVYAFMLEKSKLSDYEAIRYIYKGAEEPSEEKKKVS